MLLKKIDPNPLNGMLLMWSCVTKLSKKWIKLLKKKNVLSGAVHNSHHGSYIIVANLKIT